MKLYVSGPISGLEPGEAKLIFGAASRLLTAYGYDAIDPHDIGACLTKDCEGGVDDSSQPDSFLHGWHCYLKYDLIDMMKCDGVALLDNWEESRGARLEWNTAKELAIPAHAINWWLNNARVNQRG